MNLIKSYVWIIFLFVLLIAGCGSDNNDTNTLGSDPRVTPGGTPTVFAQFDAAYLPLPNDVAWGANGGVCPDGQVCLAPDAGDSAELAGLKQLVNAQGVAGLSPNMFLTVPLTGAVDSSTLSMQMFRIDDATLLNDLFVAGQANPAGVPAALNALDYRTQANFIVAPDVNSGVVKLLPQKPLIPGAQYAVVVGPGLTDSNGYPAVSSFTMKALKSTVPFAADSPYSSFESLRSKFNDGATALFDIVSGVTNITSGGTAPWLRDDVLVMWTFNTATSTLSLTPTTPGSDTVNYPDGVTDPFNSTTAALKAASAGFVSNALSWTNPATGASEAGPTGIPASTLFASMLPDTSGLGNVYSGTYLSPLLDGSGTTTVSFRLTMPATTGPHPIVLFQHGITSSKDAALGIANTLGTAGYATLAIDAIFHGDRTTGTSSGDGFFTTNLIQNRANLYQAAIDLWEAVDVIGADLNGIDLDGDTNADLDGAQIEYFAHSLGSIIGSVFLSQETRVDQMILGSPSALLVNVLDETSLPSMQALITALGYTPGTTEYYVFLNLAQWLLDPTDGSYNGIGTNPTSKLMTLSAYSDPIVATSSTNVFLTNIGLDPANTVTVDPAAGLTIPGDLVAGIYEYGLSGTPIVHSFMLSPLFDTATDPWYSGYDPAAQVNATTAAQTQVAGYLP